MLMVFAFGFASPANAIASIFLKTNPPVSPWHSYSHGIGIAWIESGNRKRGLRGVNEGRNYIYLLNYLLIYLCITGYRHQLHYSVQKRQSTTKAKGIE